MTWQCVANGANGLVYFTYRLLYKDGAFLSGRWADICAAAESVRQFVPVLLSDEEPPAVTGATEALSVRAWRHRGSVYLAVVNNTHYPVDGDIVPDGLGVAILRAPLSGGCP